MKFFKKIFLITALLFLSSLTWSQALTTVTATIHDPNGTLFSNGTVQADYQRPSNQTGIIPISNTTQLPIVEHGPSLSAALNSGGTFTLNLANLLQVAPSGGTWLFTLCSNTNAACQQIPSQLVVGASVDLSVALNYYVNTIKVVAQPIIAKAYIDSEVAQSPGVEWLDVTLNTLKYINAAGAVTIVGSGGGGGGGTPSGNGAFILSTNLSNPTNAGDILTLDSAGNAQDLTLNSTKLFLSTSTAPTNVSTSWTYSFATSQPELQTNALVGYVVSNSGYSCTAPCNNFTGLTVTASTTTTFTVVNVNGSATNTGTPLATFGTPLYPAIITSTLFSIGNALTSWGFIGGGFVSGSSGSGYAQMGDNAQDAIFVDNPNFVANFMIGNALLGSGFVNQNSGTLGAGNSTWIYGNPLQIGVNSNGSTGSCHSGACPSISYGWVINSTTTPPNQATGAVGINDAADPNEIVWPISSVALPTIGSGNSAIGVEASTGTINGNINNAGWLRFPLVIEGNGTALVPNTSGVINVVGTGNATVSAATNVLTVNVTGGGTGTITSVTPNLNGGSAAQGIFSVSGASSSGAAVPNLNITGTQYGTTYFDNASTPLLQSTGALGQGQFLMGAPSGHPVVGSVVSGGTGTVTVTTTTSGQIQLDAPTASYTGPCIHHVFPGTLPITTDQICPSSGSCTSPGTTTFATTISVSPVCTSAGAIIKIQAHGTYVVPGTGAPVASFNVTAGNTTGICPTIQSWSLTSTATSGYWALECNIQLGPTSFGSASATSWGFAETNTQTSNGSPTYNKRGNFTTATQTVTYSTNLPYPVSISMPASWITGQTFNLTSMDVQVIQ